MTVTSMTQKPFKDLLTQDDLCPLDYIARLSQAGLNNAKIGEKIGRTGSAVSGYFNQGTAPKVVELAAKAVWMEEYAPKKTNSKRVAAIVRGEPAHLKTIQDLIKGIGGDFTFIGDM